MPFGIGEKNIRPSSDFSSNFYSAKQERHRTGSILPFQCLSPVICFRGIRFSLWNPGFSAAWHATHTIFSSSASQREYTLFRFPGIVLGNILDDIRRCYFSVCKLDMRFRIVAGCKVYLDCALVIERDSAFVVIKAPVGKVCCDDDRLMQKTAPEIVLGTLFHNGIS